MDTTEIAVRFATTTDPRQRLVSFDNVSRTPNRAPAGFARSVADRLLV